MYASLYFDGTWVILNDCCDNCLTRRGVLETGLVALWPLLLTWINFNPSMLK